MNDALQFTGERFLPECQGEMWYEHWHRYRFVRTLARGKRVLDLACGEGYGTALLAEGATLACGVDRSMAAIQHARSRYFDLPASTFVAADCAALPFSDASFDLVVSFETLEHIDRQAEFLKEVRRVLAHDGIFVLSSPNKSEYSDARGYRNEYHIGELYREELDSLLAEHFSHRRWFGQRNAFASVIWAEGRVPLALSQAEWHQVDRLTPRAETPLPEPMYFLIVTSAQEAPLDACLAELSLLGDREEFIYRDYEKAIQDVRRLEPAREALAAQLWNAEHLLREARALLAERESNASDLKTEVQRLSRHLMEKEAEVADCRASLAVEREQAGIEVEALRAQITNLTKQSFDLHASAARDHSRLREMDSRLREREQVLMRQTEQLTRQAHEINRRASLLWWLKLPWLRITKRLPPS